MKKFLLICLASLCALVAVAAEASRDIQVSGQAAFDRLDTDIKAALQQGVTQLNVTLRPGTYYYHDRHLDFAGLQYPKASVTISGNGAVLVGRDGKGEDDWQTGCFDVAQCGDVMLWSTLEQSPEEVTVVDVASKLCRIRTVRAQKALNADQCAGQYVQVTEWYDAKVYPVVRRTRHYIYFSATDLAYSEQYRHWNVNYDVAYGKCNPRYRTIDVSDVSAAGRVACRASTFARFWHARLGRVTLQGINFGPNHGAAPLIDTDMFACTELRLDRCGFAGIRGLVVKVWLTDNVTVAGCTFSGCYQNGVESWNGSRRLRVTGCTFRNHGRGLRQTFGVVCRGEDFEVSRNTFRNFCYAAIGAGVYHGHTAEHPVTGRVADNDIAFEPEYYDHFARYTLMDGGAIYAWTKTDGVRITGNHIAHYRGVKDYRGIFCDDGTKNVTVQQNTVTDIGDGCWCIDLRWVEHVSGSVPDHNTGNRISDNTVDGRVRFETRKP